ncbi:MAG: hypothetical protein Fur0012_00100 [Elusimicrobiota bacterium]
MKLSQIREKIWIRKDRENLFFSGLILASIAASTVTTYWHFYDRTELRPKIKLNTGLTKEKQYKLLKEAENSTAGLKEKTTSFYNVETYASPTVPPPGEEGQ